VTYVTKCRFWLLNAKAARPSPAAPPTDPPRLLASIEYICTTIKVFDEVSLWVRGGAALAEPLRLLIDRDAGQPAAVC